MRVFDHPNTNHGFTCPICKTAEDKPVVLVGKESTREGNIMEADQVHLDCLELTSLVLPDGKMLIVQQVG